MDSSDDDNGLLDSGTQAASGQSDEAVFTSPATLALLNRIYHLQRSGNLPQGVSISTILSVLRNQQSPRNEEDDDEDDDSYNWNDQSRPSKPPPGGWYPKVTEPQDAGVELLYSGSFGRVANKIRARGENPNRNIASAIRKRFEGRRNCPPITREDVSNHLVPNSNGTAVARYAANIYTASYSTDSSFYYTCSQDFRLYLFDSSMPHTTSQDRDEETHDHNIETNMAVKRSIQGVHGRWTITDANLSPDNQRLIYSSITPTVYMTSTVDQNPVQHPINFSGDHGIYSCTFSADGNEIIAGGNGNIFVYDLLGDRETVNIHAHNDDVNSCCWADTSSGNILVSASDDSFLKVWDRRSLGTSPKPSGVLIGHTEGITYVSAKGDGRYVISNGKDQSLRLWDLRKMRSPMEHDKVARKHYGIPGFDYRYPPYEKPRHQKHPLDCSVMTYRGHSVMRTLIRCKFSPVETTGGQYIYSGSTDGQIHIWSLDGTVVQVLDRTQTLSMGNDPSAPEAPTNIKKRKMCVRDVSWNSKEPVLMSAAWSGGHGYGGGGSILARHEWKGLQKLRGSLEDWTLKENAEASETAGNGRRQSRRLSELRRREEAPNQMPGAFDNDNDDVDGW